jgi:hypothetical protein
MAIHELVILWAVRAALVVALIGLFRRNRVRQCYSFVAYAAIVLVCGTLMSLWPARFWTKDFWLARQALYDAAKLVLAGELAWRVLRAFPGAMRTAQLWAMVLLPVAVLLVVGVPSTGFESFGEWQPKMMTAPVALFAMTAVLTLYYHLPLRPWHRALLLGFTAYLLAFNVLLEVLRTEGLAIRSWFNAADGTAYLALVVWWAIEAWRPDPVLGDIPLAVQRRLGLAEPEGA